MNWKYSDICCRIRLNGDCLEDIRLKSIEIFIEALREMFIAFRLVRLVKKEAYTNKDVKERLEVVVRLVCHGLPNTCHNKFC